MNQYIADIRALFEALEKRVLLPDHRNRIAQQQREALEPSANAARVPAETAWDKQVKDLETKLDALKVRLRQGAAGAAGAPLRRPFTARHAHRLLR